MIAEWQRTPQNSSSRTATKGQSQKTKESSQIENEFGVEAANLLRKEAVGMVGEDSAIDEGTSLDDEVSLNPKSVSLFREHIKKLKNSSPISNMLLVFPFSFCKIPLQNFDLHFQTHSFGGHVLSLKKQENINNERPRSVTPII
jgi:hypothetical protein